MDRAAANIAEQVSVGYDVESFGHMPKSDRAGSYGRFVLSNLSTDTFSPVLYILANTFYLQHFNMDDPQRCQVIVLMASFLLPQCC